MVNKNYVIRILNSIVPLLVLLIIWEILSSLQILNPALFSRPTRIFGTIFNMLFIDLIPAPISIPFVMDEVIVLYVGTLVFDIFSSLFRLSISFILASVIGILIGLVMGSSQYVHKFVDPIITVLMPIPGIAWAPIFLVWLGFGDPTLLAVGFLAAIFPIIQNVSAATTSIDQKMVWASQSMGANNHMVLTKVLIPHSFPFLLTGFKLGIARAWRTIIAVELIAGTLAGLGVMIFIAREFLQPYKIYGGIIVLALIYFAIELGIRQIEKRTIQKWGMVYVGELYE
ncbi:MAG: ABC transporter permease [Candidatus Hodarchaeota archaeon]